jgi:16S rRNA (cytidine1402-2'-O)-methyltransferase
MDAALREAMATLSPSRAAAEVAARLGLPKRRVYERAQQLK